MNVFVDASYAIHDNMRRHTDECIIFCRVALISKSIKQHLDTTKSCVAELVGTSDYIPSAIYAILFQWHRDTKEHHLFYIKTTKALLN